MKAVVQRVSLANVTVGNQQIAAIGRGLLVLVGVGRGDSVEDANWLADKIVRLRIFEDDADKMNLSALDVRGEVLAVSQFTLSADCTRGRRPSFDTAAPPVEAELLFNDFVAAVRREGLTVATGKFGAHMAVGLINDGPVSFILESPPGNQR
jgi:D-tyrosyl-tRNA(Tyr) deacylase